MYFFDTYAIIEIYKGSKNYERFKSFNITTGVLNIGELYQLYLKREGKELADTWFDQMNFEILELSPEIIKEAVHFRFINKGKNISLVDAVGYVLSLKHKLRFLTGDQQFEKVSHVEFVK